MQYNRQNPSGTPGGSSLVARILILSSGGALLLLAAIIFISIISKPTDPAALLMTSIAQQETEIARVAGEGAQNAQSQPTIDFATTTQLSIESDQYTLLALLNSLGEVPSQKTLGLTKSSATDTRLAAAKADGSYDQTYVAIMQAELNSYGQTLQQAAAVSRHAKEQQWLALAMDHTKKLIQMSSQTE